MHLAGVEPTPIASFERGIDRASARTNIEKGGYEDAQNLILWCATHGGKHLHTVARDVPLDPDVAWPPGNVWFVAPYVVAEYANSVLTLTPHLVIVRSTGQMHRYDYGSPGTVVPVRRGFTTSHDLWTSTLYGQLLILVNGRDAPMKYGPHWALYGEARPFAFPLGSRPITPMGAAIAGESWAFGANSGFVADASVPGGGARVHTASVRVAPGESATLTFGSPRNLLAGPYPYGGTDFAPDKDWFLIQAYSTANPSFTVTFQKDASNYVTFTFTSTTTGTWVQGKARLDAGTKTGSDTLETIYKNVASVVFTNTGAADVYLDDCYFLYTTAPPAIQVVASHKQRLVGGGAPVAADGVTSSLSNVYFSRAGFPDEWPATNVAVITPGAAMSRANRITALREFGSALLVGTPHGIVAFTVDANGQAVQQLVTSEHGVDSHRSMVETPNGALLFFWQRSIFIVRSTWRAFAATKIVPYLGTLDLTASEYTVGVFDERTQTLRFWWRTTAKSGTTSAGIILDYVRAQELGEGVWPSTMTQMADVVATVTRAGQREVLYARYDSPQIYRLGASETGPLPSSVTLPWMSLEARDKVVKWLGCEVSYISAAPIRVEVRYAGHPSEFDSAEFETLGVLPANPRVPTQGRVLFGRSARWAQVRLSATEPMEIFPPVNLLALPTQRQP